MSKNQPRCHCGGEMKRNGTTSKGTTRWRCKQCGASSVKRRNDITNAAVFTQFIEHCTTAISLDDLAKRNGVSRATMKRRFKWCWLVDVPDPTAGHHKRIYDRSSTVEWCNRFVSFGLGYALSWSGVSSCWVGCGVSRDLVRMSRLR